MLTKLTLDAALEGELTEHPGYKKHTHCETDNSRNSTTRKTLQTEDGVLELDIPRDRLSRFEPKLVKKHQRRLPSMSDKILSLYARGMTTREIQDTFMEM